MGLFPSISIHTATRGLLYHHRSAFIVIQKRVTLPQGIREVIFKVVNERNASSAENSYRSEILGAIGSH